MDIQTEPSPTVTFTTNHRSSRQTGLLLWYLQHISWSLGGWAVMKENLGKAVVPLCVSVQVKEAGFVSSHHNPEPPESSLSCCPPFSTLN